MRNGIILTFCLAFLAGCSSSDDTSGPKGPTHPVEVGKVIQQDVPIYLEAIGNVGAWHAVEVRPQIQGKLFRSHVGSGQKVKKGDLLYSIDSRPFQAAREKAQALLLRDKSALALAEKKVERYTELRKQDFVSQLTYDELQTDVESCKAQVAVDEALVEEAQINLDYCSIHASMDGKIGNLNIDPGNIISPSDSTALTVLRQLSPVVIRFTLAQKDFQQVKKTHEDGDMTIEVFLPEEPHQAKQGDVYFVDNCVDKRTGTIVMKGYLPNEDEFLWPGEFVRVRLLVRREPNALLVPQEAVQIGQKGHYVYVLNPETQTVAPHLVTIGGKIEGFIVIKTGVELGDTVVTDGQLNLYPGAKVIAVNQPQEEEA